MNAEIFAEWMRRQGHRVFRTASSYWFDAGPHVLQAFPYQWQINPEKDEIRNLMLAHGIAAVRYSASLDCPNSKQSYHVVLNRPYELNMLKSQARNGVKRGLDHFSVEQISFERLATEGWVLQQDTLLRQDRLRSMTQAQWESLCLSATGLDGMEAWAAISNGELAGAAILCTIDDVVTVPYAMSHSRFLADHVNNALFFSISREALSREGVNSVFFTVQSLDAPPNVDEFKFRMGFQVKDVCQRVEFHPFLAPFATSLALTWITKLLARDPSNPFLSKAEGMLRFHVEGKRDWMENNRNNQDVIKEKLAGCQLPNVPKLSEGLVLEDTQPFLRSFKRRLAVPWNYYVKRWLKQAYRFYVNRFGPIRTMKDVEPAKGEWSRMAFAVKAETLNETQAQSVEQLPRQIVCDSLESGNLSKGDWVRVRSWEEIKPTLDPFNETRGCAFLEEMRSYCGTKQRVMKPMERFLDERDYKVKKVRGVLTLENVICNGTPAFGRCDRCCFLFWREEWLEKIAA